MGKASGKAEFRTIAAKLEIGIRQNRYVERIPELPALMEEFSVSKQTITRALSLLRNNGVLKFKGRSGMLIDRSALKKRKIAIVAAWTDGRKKDLLSVLDPLIENMDMMGFEVDIIRGDSQENIFQPEHFINDYDGFLLNNRFRYESTVKKIVAARIPFVCTSRLLWAPEVDSVWYDTISAVRQIATDLKNSGFRKIALLYTENTSGANDQMYSAWRKIKKELGLPRLSCDRVRFNDGGSWEKNAALLFSHIKNMKEKPEVLIHYGGKFDERIASYRQETPGYPFGMRVVYQESLWEHCSFSPEDIIIKSSTRAQLLTESFCVLLERFLDPESPPIHRKLFSKVEYMQELPRISKTS